MGQLNWNIESNSGISNKKYWKQPILRLFFNIILYYISYFL